MGSNDTDQSETDPANAAPVFGDTLRRLREQRGLSQNGLASAAGTDPGTVNRLESGKRAPVNRQLLDKLARALGLSSEDRTVLLALAGHAPDSIARLGLYDPDLLLVADILADTSIPDDEKGDFRLGLRVLARRWRPTSALSLAKGYADGRMVDSQPGQPSRARTAPELPDWENWM